MNATAPEGAATPPAGDDLYSDGAPEAPEKAAEEKEDKPEGGDDAIEAVLPRSILAGKTFEVGDEVILKITAMHDNEISVKYAPAKESGGDKEAPTKEDAPMTEGDPEYD